MSSTRVKKPIRGRKGCNLWDLIWFKVFGWIKEVLGMTEELGNIESGKEMREDSLLVDDKDGEDDNKGE